MSAPFPTHLYREAIRALRTNAPTTAPPPPRPARRPA